MSGINPLHVANTVKAREIYLASTKPDMARADWRQEVLRARQLILEALRASKYFSDIDGALRSCGGHNLVFRHLLAPPVSQDQFKLLCPLWKKASENKRRPLSADVATAISAVIKTRLNNDLVRWKRANRQITRRDVTDLLRAVSALMAAQSFSTGQRKRMAIRQEKSVVDLLAAHGWTRLKSKTIHTTGAIPSKHFMHKTRFVSGKTGKQEVDIACGLKDTYVLAMECKVTNDETNSVKRINDVLKKAAAWKAQWGAFVVTAALLEGVIAAKDAQRLSDNDVEVFWSHDLPTFQAWLAAQT